MARRQKVGSGALQGNVADSFDPLRRSQCSEKQHEYLQSVYSLLFAMTLQVSAADYGYVDAGDVYYINDWGANNRRVVVVRKMGGVRVKVRDVATGETPVVSASTLLTSDELKAEEFENAAIGTGIAIGILGCLMNPEACE